MASLFRWWPSGHGAVTAYTHSDFPERQGRYDRAREARRAALAASEGADPRRGSLVRHLPPSARHDGRSHRAGVAGRRGTGPVQLSTGVRALQLRGRGPDHERPRKAPGRYSTFDPDATLIFVLILGIWFVKIRADKAG